MKAIYLLSLLLLCNSCLPKSASTPESVQADQDLPSLFGQTLVQDFSSDLLNQNIQIITTRGYLYTQENPQGLGIILQHFYQQNPGFCPLKNAFFPAQDPSIYMTLLGKARAIRGFIYDLREKPKISYVFFEAQSQIPLERVSCN